MFKKLRNRFILTNMVITTIILVAAFGTIFTINAINVKRPPQSPPEITRDMPNDFQEMMQNEIIRDRNQHLGNLALTLVLVGLATELAVFGASKYYAEKSIQPVKDAYFKQREFIANASHELKTPIASARANFEALGTTEQPWTDNVDAELDRASKLVGDLLTLARTDGRVTNSEKKTVDLTKLIKNRVKLKIAQLEIDNKKLQLNLPNEFSTKIAENDFIQIFDILFDDAIKYSHKKIIVELDNKTLLIKNDGHKIPDDKIGKIFERFYQVDKTTEGSGLGLSIATAVAEQNHWHITATSDKKLTIFKLTF